MRKIISLVLAILLTMSVFVVMSGADTITTKQIVIPEAGSAIDVSDGVNTSGEWDAIPSNDGFTAYHEYNTAKRNDYSASFKTAYRIEGEKAYLYLLLTVVDPTLKLASTWDYDAFCISIDENGDGTTELETPTMYILEERTWASEQQKKDFGCDRLTYKGVKTNDGSADVGYTVEMKYEFKNASDCDGSILINIGVQDKNTDQTNACVRYTWSNNYNSGSFGAFKPKAVGIISPVATQAGASMRVAADMNATGLRFETRIDKTAYDALAADANVASIKTGTLILPTDYLTDNSVELTKAALDAADVTYLDIVNDENEWASTADGYYTFCGSITNIKTGNHDRAFSGVGYMEITYENGSTEIFYGGYNAQDHSRTVKAVATAAYNSGDYDNNTAAKALLAQYAGISQ